MKNIVKDMLKLYSQDQRKSLVKLDSWRCLPWLDWDSCVWTSSWSHSVTSVIWVSTWSPLLNRKNAHKRKCLFPNIFTQCIKNKLKYEEENCKTTNLRLKIKGSMSSAHKHKIKNKNYNVFPLNPFSNDWQQVTR